MRAVVAHVPNIPIPLFPRWQYRIELSFSAAVSLAQVAPWLMMVYQILSWPHPRYKIPSREVDLRVLQRERRLLSRGHCPHVDILHAWSSPLVGPEGTRTAHRGMRYGLGGIFDNGNGLEYLEMACAHIISWRSKFSGTLLVWTRVVWGRVGQIQCWEPASNSSFIFQTLPVE